MNNTLRVIRIKIIVFLVLILSIDNVTAIDIFKSGKKLKTLDESRNRFPEILRDVKVLTSDAMIADFHKDTLEVAFLLSKIFELLMEADQIGEKNLEDKEEFDRFERSFKDIRTNKLTTVQAIDAPVMAERIIDEIIQELDREEENLILVIWPP